MTVTQEQIKELAQKIGVRPSDLKRFLETKKFRKNNLVVNKILEYLDREGII